MNNKKEISLYEKWLEYLEIIHQKTGVKGKYVIVGLLTSIVFVSIGFLDRIITNIVGTVYPAYWTMKSIESKSSDAREWLTYWVVFACFTLIDTLSGFLLKYIPFYFFFKIIFLIWLFMPDSRNCTILYNLVIVKLFKSVEKDIDEAGVKFGELTKGLINQTNEAIEKGKSEVIKKTAATIFEENPKKKKK
jgi:receptor expression-enhancing protein 5/6